MPYEATDTAAWWHGAEPLPPKPEGPGPWALTGTAYGWEWRRAEDAPPSPSLKPRAVVPGPFLPVGGVDDAIPLCVRREPSPWRGRLARAELEAASSHEVRVGDRVQRGHAPPARVLHLGEHEGVRVAYLSGLGGGYGDLWNFRVPVGDIRPPGAGSAWTLLPRDSAPHVATTLPASMGHIPGPPTDADLAAMRAEAQARIEARRTGVGDGAKFAIPPAPPGPTDPCAQAAVRTLGRLGYVWLGGTEWKPPLGPVQDFARRDAEDTRRAALERVAVAARRFGASHDENFAARLAALRDALAALDAGPPG